LRANQELGRVKVYKGKKDSVPVVAVESIKMPLSREEKEKLRTELTLDET